MNNGSLRFLSIITLFCSVIVQLPAVTLSVLKNFGNEMGFRPRSRLVQGKDGNFYGTATDGNDGIGGSVFKLTPSGVLTTLYSFNLPNMFNQNLSGIFPIGGLIQAHDGNLYGTVPSGGDMGAGIVFKISTSGGFTVLASFNVQNGFIPNSTLIEGPDGNFYGTTESGGANYGGNIFKMTPTGVLTDVADFQNDADTLGLSVSLTLGRDGNFYGTTLADGSVNDGTIFRLSPGGVLTTLVTFTGSNGAHPATVLSQGTDGNFYGTTQGGGSSGNGTVFTVTPTGLLSTLYSFDVNNSRGIYNPSSLQQGPDGLFYGTTVNGGPSNLGTVFKIDSSGHFTSLYNLTVGTGYNPGDGITVGTNGLLYGTTTAGGAMNGGSVFTVTSTGRVGLVCSFDATVGAQPYGALLQAKDGNLYGTTMRGGCFGIGGLYGESTASGGADFGTVFRVTPAGTVSSLYSFNPLTSGSYPESSVIQGADGNVYGILSEGPPTNSIDGYEYGEAFKLSLSGVESNFVSFDPSRQGPPNGILQASDGSYYGTAKYGGTSNGGTVYKIDKSGNCTVLANFNGSLGQYPTAGLVQGPDGNFYGTTCSGGTSGYGTVFTITPSGNLSSLVSFNGVNGRAPFSALALGQDGCFYGTTEMGGSNGDGTIFKITPQGALTTLVSFKGSNGAFPLCGLLPLADNSFEGVTESGGTGGKGTIFNVSSTGVLTTLVSFSGSNGEYPTNSLIRGNDGNLYGTTKSGGSNGEGVLFRLDLAVLPSGWVQGDIGSPVFAGNSFFSNGTFTVLGGGADIWGKSDQCQFAWQTLSGNGSIIALVDSQTGGKSGVMFRDQVPPSATAATSPYIDMVLHDGTPKCEYRSGAGQNAVIAGRLGSVRTPYWVKLSRTGSLFTGSVSNDGVTWTQVGQGTIAMSTTVQVGLVQCAHNANGSSAGSFGGVSIVPSP